MVFEGVGHSVEKCNSIEDIEFRLQSPDRPDALVISGELGKAPRVATYLANAELPLPVILFAEMDEFYTESAFDLVIPVLTSPSDWLSRIEETIVRFRDRREDLNALGPSQHATTSGCSN
jgi:hypothetical protein